MIGIKEGDIISVILTKEQHQVFTNLWRDVIEYGTDYDQLSKGQVLEIAQDIYKDNPELSEIVTDWFMKVVKE